MTLLDHLASTGEGVAAFADRIGVARSTVRKIAYRQRQPSLDLAVKIIAATDGRVRPIDMVVAQRDVAEQVAA